MRLDLLLSLEDRSGASLWSALYQSNEFDPIFTRRQHSVVLPNLRLLAWRLSNAAASFPPLSSLFIQLAGFVNGTLSKYILQCTKHFICFFSVRLSVLYWLRLVTSGNTVHFMCLFPHTDNCAEPSMLHFIQPHKYDILLRASFFIVNRMFR